MQIQEYLRNLKNKSQNIFEESLIFQSELGKTHHLSSCVSEFADHITDESEREILTIVCTQLESATLNATLGLYRQAFSSLRLALELGLAEIYFSIHKLKFKEWLDARADIRWSEIMDENYGILSKRFAKAFFPELSAEIVKYESKAQQAYRKLSEFVHGNNETWIKSGLQINYNRDLLESYFQIYNEVVEVILFALTCRYSKEFSPQSLDSLHFISEELSHIHEIRERFGGPGAGR